MDDSHHQQQHQDSSKADLRHFFSPTPMLSALPYPPPPQSPFSAAVAGVGGGFSPFHYPQSQPQYEMMVAKDRARGHVPSNRGLQVQDSAASATVATTSASVGARWPRHETLRLLEVRSKLDHMFKEANQKGPLWDQVSRIMNEEYRHQRSGKKCREKFENLYKYYKKTRDGKGGRQDGKNYRFFRQLESIYGQQPSSSMKNSTANTSLHDHDQEEGRFSLSMSSSELQTSSSDNDNPNREKKRGKRRWKSKILKFIELEMNKIMENQETWLNKVMFTVQHKEKERMLRDEEWRNKELERIEQEHWLWAEERAWIEARDRALIDALQGHLSNHGVGIGQVQPDIGIGGGGGGNPMSDGFNLMPGNH